MNLRRANGDGNRSSFVRPSASQIENRDRARLRKPDREKRFTQARRQTGNIFRAAEGNLPRRNVQVRRDGGENL